MKLLLCVLLCSIFISINSKGIKRNRFLKNPNEKGEDKDNEQKSKTDETDEKVLSEGSDFLINFEDTDTFCEKNAIMDFFDNHYQCFGVPLYKSGIDVLFLDERKLKNSHQHMHGFSRLYTTFLALYKEVVLSYKDYIQSCCALNLETKACKTTKVFFRTENDCWGKKDKFLLNLDDLKKLKIDEENIQNEIDYEVESLKGRKDEKINSQRKKTRMKSKKPIQLNYPKISERLEKEKKKSI